MPKYFFSLAQLHDKQIIIDGETAHHLLHVLRANTGDTIILCDGAATDYHGNIVAIKSKPPSITIKIEDTHPSSTESPTKVSLYQGFPKGDKMDLIIQKCVELGIHEIIPVITSRSVVRDSAKKGERYQRIAESAAGQSMRGIVPKVHTALSFKDAAKQVTKTTLVAYEDEKNRNLKSILTKQPAAIDIWIGPEGGFSKEEISTLTAKGAKTFTLGPRILRTETAAIASLAQIMFIVESDTT